MFPVIANPPDEYSCLENFCTEDVSGGIDLNQGASTRDCVAEVAGAFRTWKTVIQQLLGCVETGLVPSNLCGWITASADLVNQNIDYLSPVDWQNISITAAEFDRKYFPLIYGAQGIYP